MAVDEKGKAKYIGEGVQGVMYELVDDIGQRFAGKVAQESREGDLVNEAIAYETIQEKSDPDENFLWCFDFHDVESVDSEIKMLVLEYVDGASWRQFRANFDESLESDEQVVEVWMGSQEQPGWQAASEDADLNGDTKTASATRDGASPPQNVDVWAPSVKDTKSASKQRTPGILDVYVAKRDIAYENANGIDALITRDLFRAKQHVAKAGYQYGDTHDGNVMINAATGRPKLIDPGFALEQTMTARENWKNEPDNTRSPFVKMFAGDATKLMAVLAKKQHFSKRKLKQVMAHIAQAKRTLRRSDVGYSDTQAQIITEGRQEKLREAKLLYTSFPRLQNRAGSFTATVQENVLAHEVGMSLPEEIAGDLDFESLYDHFIDEANAAMMVRFALVGHKIDGNKEALSILDELARKMSYSDVDENTINGQIETALKHLSVFKKNVCFDVCEKLIASNAAIERLQMVANRDEGDIEGVNQDIQAIVNAIGVEENAPFPKAYEIVVNKLLGNAPALSLIVKAANQRGGDGENAKRLIQEALEAVELPGLNPHYAAYATAFQQNIEKRVNLLRKDEMRRDLEMTGELANNPTIRKALQQLAVESVSGDVMDEHVAERIEDALKNIPITREDAAYERYEKNARAYVQNEFFKLRTTPITSVATDSALTKSKDLLKKTGDSPGGPDASLESDIPEKFVDRIDGAMKALYALKYRLKRLTEKHLRWEAAGSAALEKLTAFEALIASESRDRDRATALSHLERRERMKDLQALKNYMANPKKLDEEIAAIKAEETLQESWEAQNARLKDLEKRLLNETDQKRREPIIAELAECRASLKKSEDDAARLRILKAYRPKLDQLNMQPELRRKLDEELARLGKLEELVERRKQAAERMDAMGQKATRAYVAEMLSRVPFQAGDDNPLAVFNDLQDVAFPKFYEDGDALSSDGFESLSREFQASSKEIADYLIANFPMTLAVLNFDEYPETQAAKVDNSTLGHEVTAIELADLPSNEMFAEHVLLAHEEMLLTDARDVALADRRRKWIERGRQELLDEIETGILNAAVAEGNFNDAIISRTRFIAEKWKEKLGDPETRNKLMANAMAYLEKQKAAASAHKETLQLALLPQQIDIAIDECAMVSEQLNREIIEKTTCERFLVEEMALTGLEGDETELRQWRLKNAEALLTKRMARIAMYADEEAAGKIDVDQKKNIRLAARKKALLDFDVEVNKEAVDAMDTPALEKAIQDFFWRMADQRNDLDVCAEEYKSAMIEEIKKPFVLQELKAALLNSETEKELAALLHRQAEATLQELEKFSALKFDRLRTQWTIIRDKSEEISKELSEAELQRFASKDENSNSLSMHTPSASASVEAEEKIIPPSQKESDIALERAESAARSEDERIVVRQDAPRGGMSNKLKLLFKLGIAWLAAAGSLRAFQHPGDAMNDPASSLLAASLLHPHFDLPAVKQAYEVVFEHFHDDISADNECLSAQVALNSALQSSAQFKSGDNKLEIKPDNIWGADEKMVSELVNCLANRQFLERFASSQTQPVFQYLAKKIGNSSFDASASENMEAVKKVAEAMGGDAELRRAVFSGDRKALMKFDNAAFEHLPKAVSVNAWSAIDKMGATLFGNTGQTNRKILTELFIGAMAIYSPDRLNSELNLSPEKLEKIKAETLKFREKCGERKFELAFCKGELHESTRETLLRQFARTKDHSLHLTFEEVEKMHKAGSKTNKVMPMITDGEHADVAGEHSMRTKRKGHMATKSSSTTSVGKTREDGLREETLAELLEVKDESNLRAAFATIQKYIEYAQNGLAQMASPNDILGEQKKQISVGGDKEKKGRNLK